MRVWQVSTQNLIKNTKYENYETIYQKNKKGI